jgi:hypothetical protein
MRHDTLAPWAEPVPGIGFRLAHPVADLFS